jgi:hypothetical protein
VLLELFHVCGDGSSAVADERPGELLAAITVAGPANGPVDGNYPASGDASASVGPAVAEHCGAERCNCCRVLLRSRKRAASGREPRTPD